jgi:HEAT repeat protein
VRRDAAEAIGALAGPSMAATVRPLVNDPDAEVKAAAVAALARLGG